MSAPSHPPRSPEGSEEQAVRTPDPVDDDATGVDGESSLQELPRHGITASQWQTMKLSVSIGVVSVVAGGVVAGITGPAEFATGSWLAAYLVLVAGVGQLGLGLGQAMLAPVTPSATNRRWQFVVYNAGNVAVLVGTMTESVTMVIVGGAGLLVALVLFSYGVGRSRGRRRYLAVYWLLIAVLAVSVPIGLTLSILRHG